MSLEGSKSFRVCFLCAWARVGALQVTHSPLATTAPGHGETPGSAEPCPLFAGEGPGESCTHVSQETVALALRQPPGEPGPSNDNDTLERTKYRRRRGAKNTSTVTIRVEAASPPEASREEEETMKARDKGNSWGEVLVEY